MKKTLLVLLVAFFATLSFAQNFEWLHEKPQGNTIRWVKTWDANNWYAAGLYGLFMKTTNAGVSWNIAYNCGVAQTAGYFTDIYDAHFFNQTTGIAVGSLGVYKTTNSGATWTQVYTTTGTLYQVYFLNSNIGYASGTSAVKVIKTTDGGNTWAAVTGATASVSYYDVFTANDTTIIAASTTGNVYRSTDGGTTFTAVSTGVTANLYKVEFKDALNGVVAGSVSAVRTTTDGGATWTSINTLLPASQNFYDLKYNANGIYLVGNSYAIIHTSNNGTSWDSLLVVAPGSPWTSTQYAADFYTGGAVSVGAFGLINKIAGGTTTSLSKLIKPGTNYDVIKDPNGSSMLAVGAPTVVNGVFDQFFATTDLGQNWVFPTVNKQPVSFNGTIEVFPQEDNLDIKGVDVKTPTSTSTFRNVISRNNGLWAVGSNGAIYKSTNGLVWDSLTTTIPATADLYKIDFVTATTGWVFSNSTAAGPMWKTTDAGLTWTAQTIAGETGSNLRVYSAHMVNEQYGWLVNYQPRPFKTTDGGNTWVKQELEDAFGGFLYDVHMIDTTTGFLCGSSGRIYKTTNGGVNWDSINVGLSVTFNAIDFVNANFGAIAGSNGIVLTTTNGGATWNKIVTNSNASFYGIDVAKPNSSDSTWIIVCGSNGVVMGLRNWVVPVELSSFTANVKDRSVVLNWSTATETNNQGFDIERKSNSGWSKIGYIQGNGTTTEIKRYAFTDANLNSGVYTYRIKQIDFDGTYKYFNLNSEVVIGTPSVYTLAQNYPNPFNPSTVINYAIPKAGVVSIKVYNVLGKEVATLVNEYQEAGNYSKELSLKNFNLSSGVYFYTLKADNFTATKKLVVLK